MRRYPKPELQQAIPVASATPYLTPPKFARMLLAGRYAIWTDAASQPPLLTCDVRPFLFCQASVEGVLRYERHAGVVQTLLNQIHHCNKGAAIAEPRFEGATREAAGSAAWRTGAAAIMACNADKVIILCSAVDWNICAPCVITCFCTCRLAASGASCDAYDEYPVV